MKKAASLILSIIIFMSFAVTANAEVFNGDDLFTVDVPESFEKTSSNVTKYTFADKSGDSFSVSYSDNKTENKVFCVKELSKKEIENYADSLDEEAEKIMKAYYSEFDMFFLSCEKVQHKSGKMALVSQTKTIMTQEGKTKVYYQTIYEFGGADNKYTFTYTTSKEEKKDDFNEVFDSIVINEAEAEVDEDFSVYIVAGVIALIFIVGIIRFIRTPAKRKKGKI